MSKAILKLVLYYCIYLLIFIISKPVFMAVYHGLMGDISASDWFDVIVHGLPMDRSVAGYFTVIPAFLTIAALGSDSKIIRIIERVYIALTAIIISLVFIADMALYGYWNFRLDTTPFFYFFSSPSSAMASVTTWTLIAGIAAFILLSLALYLLIIKTAGDVKVSPTHKPLTWIVTILLTAALFIPIRGSVTVSTMNLSRSYYSANQRLNHAAINPLFSLMYSATHQTDFASQFRFFTEQECSQSFETLKDRSEVKPDSIPALLKVSRPDIYIIILESFSNHLMPSLGGEDIASSLDSIASKGILFSNFYASGARTDRALPAILSAFPAQPNTSLMKYARKIEHVPSLPRTLKNEAGYDMTYYYGGDINFTNMLAYLISAGFDRVVADKDFPISQRTSKWGVHDHILFERAWAEISNQAENDTTPKLRVIQTSSSHEPFEVPYSDPRFADNPRKNAFAYTDHSLRSFIDSLASSPNWDKSLVVITPDHFGVYPELFENTVARHQVPLIITGGAVAYEPTIMPVYGDQTDIAATVLSALNIDHSDFVYSRDMFNPANPQFAFFSEPGIAGVTSANGTAVLSLDNNNQPLVLEGEEADSLADICKVMLQTIYTNLSKL